MADDYPIFFPRKCDVRELEVPLCLSDEVPFRGKDSRPISQQVHPCPVLFPDSRLLFDQIGFVASAANAADSTLDVKVTPLWQTELKFFTMNFRPPRRSACTNARPRADGGCLNAASLRVRTGWRNLTSRHSSSWLPPSSPWAPTPAGTISRPAAVGNRRRQSRLPRTRDGGPP